jgi:hypothetical protein
MPASSSQEAQIELFLGARAPEQRGADVALADRLIAHALDRDPEHAPQLAEHTRLLPLHARHVEQRNGADKGGLHRQARRRHRQGLELDAELLEVGGARIRRGLQRDLNELPTQALARRRSTGTGLPMARARSVSVRPATARERASNSSAVAGLSALPGSSWSIVAGSDTHRRRARAIPKRRGCEARMRQPRRPSPSRYPGHVRRKRYWMRAADGRELASPVRAARRVGAPNCGEGEIRTRATDGDFANVSLLLWIAERSGRTRIPRERVMEVQVMMRVMLGPRLRADTHADG